MAYATSAVRKGLASYDSEVGQIAGSILGALAQHRLGCQILTEPYDRQVGGGVRKRGGDIDCGDPVTRAELEEDLGEVTAQRDDPVRARDRRVHAVIAREHERGRVGRRRRL